MFEEVWVLKCLCMFRVPNHNYTFIWLSKHIEVAIHPTRQVERMLNKQEWIISSQRGSHTDSIHPRLFRSLEKVMYCCWWNLDCSRRIFATLPSNRLVLKIWLSCLEKAGHVRRTQWLLLETWASMSRMKLAGKGGVWMTRTFQSSCWCWGSNGMAEWCRRGDKGEG